MQFHLGEILILPSISSVPISPLHSQKSGRFNDSKHNSVTFYFVHSVWKSDWYWQESTFRAAKLHNWQSFFRFGAAVGMRMEFFTMLSLLVLFCVCSFMFIQSFARSFVCRHLVIVFNFMSVNFISSLLFSSPPIKLSKWLNTSHIYFISFIESKRASISTSFVSWSI